MAKIGRMNWAKRLKLMGVGLYDLYMNELELPEMRLTRRGGWVKAHIVSNAIYRMEREYEAQLAEARAEVAKLKRALLKTGKAYKELRYQIEDDLL